LAKVVDLVVVNVTIVPLIGSLVVVGVNDAGSGGLEDASSGETAAEEALLVGAASLSEADGHRGNVGARELLARLREPSSGRAGHERQNDTVGGVCVADHVHVEHANDIKTRVRVSVGSSQGSGAEKTLLLTAEPHKTDGVFETSATGGDDTS